MKVIIPHYFDSQPWSNCAGWAQLTALGAERYHHRTNEPHYRPDPIEFDIEYREMKAPHDYGDMLAELWDKGRSFINLEHDVAPWPGALTEMWNCRQSWCAMPLMVHQCINETNFGCVKFGAEFIKAFPNIWKEYPRNEIFDWKSLDSWLYQQVAPARHHRHGPPVLHLNPNHV